MKQQSNTLFTAALAAAFLAACAGTGGAPEGPVDAVAGDSTRPAERAASTGDPEPAVIPASQPAPRAATVAAPAGASSGAGASAQEPEAQVSPAATRRGPDRTALDVAYFNTEEWKRRFAQSFLPVTDVEPTMTEDEVIEMQAILKLISEGKKDRALGRLELANNEAASANFPFLIAQLHLEEGRDERALDMLDVALDRFDTFRRAWNSKALLHYQRGEYGDAIPAFSKAIGLGQVDEITYGLLAVCLLNEERYIAAETAFRQALMLAPDSPEWREGVGRCLLQQSRYPEAISLYASLIDRDPDNASLWLVQGNAYLGQGKTREAAENFQMADVLGGSSNASLNLLGDIYTNDELDDLAVDAYLSALDKDEDAQPTRALNAADLMTRRGSTEAATALLDGLDAHFGDSLEQETRATLLKLRAKIAVREGRGEEEVAILEDIVANDPLDGDALILLGEALERAGRHEEAYLKLETAARIEGFEARAQLRHAQLLVREGRYDDAVPLLKSSLDLDPKESVRQFLEGVEKAARRSGD